MKKALALLLVLGPIVIAADEKDTHVDTEPARVTKANYRLAEHWTANKVGKLVFDLSVTPHWLDTGDKFWYSYETSSGRNFYLVDAVKRSKALVFDNAKVAAQLTEITRTAYDARHLPFRTIKFKSDNVVEFTVQVDKDADLKAKQVLTGVEQQQTEQNETPDNEQAAEPQQRQGQGATAAERNKKTLYFEYNLSTGTVTMPPDYLPEPRKPMWASMSPDEKTIVFARKNDLYMIDAASYALALKKPDDPAIKEVQLTKDGVEGFSYARHISGTERQQLLQRDQLSGERSTEPPPVMRDKTGRVPPIVINWSKDSKKFVVIRRDERKVADLWVVHTLENPRPTLETYKYAMPGEANVPQYHMEIFDVAAQDRIEVKADRFKDQTLQPFDQPVSAKQREHQRTDPLWLASGSDKIYFRRMSRDQHKVDVCLTDAKTGEVKTLIEERLNAYVDTHPLRLVNNGQEILFWSERDGWGQWYLYDSEGKLERQVTSGEFVTEDVMSVDDKSRTMIFEAEGREPGENPYFTHLYSVKLDGSGLKLLDKGNASHGHAISDDGKYFVDNASTVSTAPRSILYDETGKQLIDLETTDISALMDAGFHMPEQFTTKADDGLTDLYGVMYKPFDFDPNKKYPIIEFVYPGPQTESVTQIFSPKSPNVALAQFGFIVIEVGNRGGNPHRSKWYHDYGYGNLRDYGLADKKAAVEDLARRDKWIDIDRVGITGHSGGGFMSTAAILTYPDFYKVAVSESGNHENNIYNQNWSEKYHGIKEVDGPDGKVSFEYSIAKNSELAKNLKGHLLLSTGDMDDNVHMANTMRLADALIKAHKRFDQFILPGMRHAYGPDADYFFWVRSDYFCRYLLGDWDQSVDMQELDSQVPPSQSARPTRAASDQQ